MNGFNVTVKGIEDVNHILATIAPNEAANIMRAMVAALAKDLAKSASARVPVVDGTLKKSIFHERQRTRVKGRRAGLLSAEVKVATDAFYWRFLEYGQGPDNVEYAFFLQTLQALRPDLDRRYLEIFTAKLIARLKRKRKALGT